MLEGVRVNWVITENTHLVRLYVGKVLSEGIHEAPFFWSLFGAHVNNYILFVLCQYQLS